MIYAKCAGGLFNAQFMYRDNRAQKMLQQES